MKRNAFTLVELPGVSKGKREAFTLVELLVVVAIIIVLLALLAPAMNTAITAAVDAKCGAQHSALVRIMAVYAVENQRKFLPGNRVSDAVEHTPWVTGFFVRTIVIHAGNSNGDTALGVVPPMLIDPVYPYFGGMNANGDFVPGYCYLGGHPFVDKHNSGSTGTPNWDSPMSLSKLGSGELTACNAYWYAGATSAQWAQVAHTKEGGPTGSKEGGYYYYFPTQSGNDPVDLMTGMNVGRADGAVIWKRAEETRKYWSAADTGTGYPDWPARW